MIQKTYSLTVQKKISEGLSACTLILSPKKEEEHLFIYKPAQFLSFHLKIDGKDIVRSYSLSGTPLMNEPLTTSIKKVEGGRASSYLVDSIQEGSVIESELPKGRFFKAPGDLKPRHYFIVAGGSGITPLFSIIKTALVSDRKNRITLIYCNRKQSEIIYELPIRECRSLYDNRLKVFHFLSRPEKGDNFDFKGRLDSARLLNIFQREKTDRTCEYYLCGPGELMKMARHLFIEQGVNRKLIRTESFGVAPAPSSSEADNAPSLPETAVIISADDNNQTAQPKIIQASLEGENISIPAKPGVPILEQLIDAGFCPPFSCMAGSCMTCMAVLKKGKVYQDEAGILAEENIEEKEILTCQAKPLSALIEVDYDY